MTTAAIAVIEYGVTEIDIAAAREKYAALTADTAKGYEDVRVAIAELRGTRSKIETRRVELKADALEFGRKVDAAAKTLTSLVVEIEEPLKAKKAVVDEAKEKARREAAAAEKAALEAKVRAEREAEEARLKAERDVEDARLLAVGKRLAAERAVFEEQKRKADAARAEEEAKLAAERAAAEATQRAAQSKLDGERADLEHQKRALAEQQAAAARAEEERLAAIQAEKDAEAARERARVAVEKEAARIAALAPDVEKVRMFGVEIRAFAVSWSAIPVTSEECGVVVASAFQQLGRLADDLEMFTPKGT